MHSLGYGRCSGLMVSVQDSGSGVPPRVQALSRITAPGKGRGGGALPYGRDGDAHRKLTPKRDQSGRGRSLCRPLKETSLKYRQIKSTVALDINVMKNFVYMNGVNITNENSFFSVISSRATLSETLTDINDGILPRTP